MSVFYGVLISTFEVDSLKLSYVFTAASIPNIFMSPIVAQILNIIGNAVGGIVLSAIIALGSILEFFACRYKKF